MGLEAAVPISPARKLALDGEEEAGQIEEERERERESACKEF